MHFWIDGYNLLFYVAKGKMTLQQKREILLTTLSAFSLNMTIVFDSASGDLGSGRGYFRDLKIIYTKEGQTADQYICDEISNTFTPKQETVVTSDRELSERCKLLGAKVQNIPSFLEQLAKKKRKKKRKADKNIDFRDSEQEIERLLKIFEARVQRDT